jgi:hypothetical protein
MLTMSKNFWIVLVSLCLSSLVSINSTAVARQKRGTGITAEKNTFIRGIPLDPKQPKHLRGYVENQIKQKEKAIQDKKNGLRSPDAKGNPYRLNTPKGHDIGHKIPGVDNHKNFRLETSTDNRARPGITRRVISRTGKPHLWNKRR